MRGLGLVRGRVYFAELRLGGGSVQANPNGSFSIRHPDPNRRSVSGVVGRNGHTDQGCRGGAVIRQHENGTGAPARIRFCFRLVWMGVSKRPKQDFGKLWAAPRPRLGHRIWGCSVFVVFFPLFCCGEPGLLSFWLMQGAVSRDRGEGIGTSLLRSLANV